MLGSSNLKNVKNPWLFSSIRIFSGERQADVVRRTEGRSDRQDRLHRLSRRRWDPPLCLLSLPAVRPAGDGFPSRIAWVLDSLRVWKLWTASHPGPWRWLLYIKNYSVFLNRWVATQFWIDGTYFWVAKACVWVGKWVKLGIILFCGSWTNKRWEPLL